jgi:predicted phage terminase large subunit-like protein
MFSLDTAYKANQHNDPSVLEVWGQVGHKHYLLDVWRGKLEYPDLKKLIADWYMKWKPDGVLIEDKASGQSLIQEFKAGVILEGFPRKIYIPAVAIEPEGDKLSRMVAESVAFEAQQVYLPEYAPWLIDFESELFGFPIATHDDQVDACSQYLKWAKSRSGAICHESTRRAITEQVKHAQKHNLGISRKSNRYGGF